MKMIVFPSLILDVATCIRLLVAQGSRAGLGHGH